MRGSLLSSSIGLGVAVTDSAAGRLAAVAAIVLWSAGNLIVKAVPMAGAQIAFWRVLLAAVIYVLILRARGRTLTWQQLKDSAPAGIAISLELAFFFVAIKSTTVANATVIGNLAPLVILAFGIGRFGEKVSRLVFSMAAVAILGVVMVVFGSSTQPIWSPFGDVLAVIAMLLFAAYFVLAKSGRATVPAFEFQTAVWVSGTVILAPVAVIDAGGVVFPTVEQWAWLALLVAVPGTGHLAMNWAHSQIKLTLASMLTLAIPVLSTVGAAVFLGEPIVGWQILGIGVVVGALAVVVRLDAPDRDPVVPVDL